MKEKNHLIRLYKTRAKQVKEFFTFTIQINFYNWFSTFIEPASSVLEKF